MKSRVAGVIDRGGGLRVVVTDGCLGCHVQLGERIYVLPKYQVQEPVSLQDAPALIARVQRYVRRHAKWRKSSL